MSTVQLANDPDNKIIVEWNKYAPHFRIFTPANGEVRAFWTEKSAMRAAKRLAKRLQVTLQKTKITD